MAIRSSSAATGAETSQSRPGATGHLSCFASASTGSMGRSGPFRAGRATLSSGVRSGLQRSRRQVDLTVEDTRLGG